MDEVKNMDEEMLKKETRFREEANQARRTTNDDAFTVNEIKKRELELAKERGEKVVKLKFMREQLEAERNRVMDDLEKIKQGKQTYQDPNSG